MLNVVYYCYASVILQVIMFSLYAEYLFFIVMLSAIMMNVIILGVVMLSVTLFNCYIECHIFHCFAECHDCFVMHSVNMLGTVMLCALCRVSCF